MNPHIHAVMLLMLLVQLHAASVTESGKPAGEAKGVKFLRMENNAAVYAVGSGDYQFQSPLPSVTLHAENAPPAPAISQERIQQENAAAKAQPVNLRGESAGEPIPIINGQFTFPLGAGCRPALSSLHHL